LTQGGLPSLASNTHEHSGPERQPSGREFTVIITPFPLQYLVISRPGIPADASSPAPSGTGAC
jgi:hypothetical protein